jgi:protein TonB
MFNAFLIAAAVTAASVTSPLTPAPALTTACTQPTAQATTVTAALAERPQIAEDRQMSGTAYVQVNTDEAGNLMDASILKSSGEYVLDSAALQAAKESTFRPEVRNCVPVAGSYIFIVDFPAE